MICYGKGDHRIGYLRYKKAGEHPHHLFEVFVRRLQASRHKIFLLLKILTRWNAESFLLRVLAVINPVISGSRRFLFQLP
jgi:hypothetical protein